MRYLKRVILATVVALTICLIGASVDAAVVASDRRDSICFAGPFEIGDSSSFLKALGELDRDYVSQHGLRLYINSSGGMGFTLRTITEILHRYVDETGCIVITHLGGMAYSAGALLFLEGNVRIMHPTASIMFHDAYFSDPLTNQKIPMDHPSVPAWAWKRLRVVNKYQRDLIRKKTKLPMAYLDSETFMDAQTALKYNVATQISE